MIYHVLPGDAIADKFRKAGIDGNVIVCRECLIVGPVDAGTPDEFWEARARFILGEYGEDQIEFQERVADELERLRDVGPDDEINLWFEYELFCQTNLWFCLSVLDGTDSTVYRVYPSVLEPADRWRGFGGLSAAALRSCFEDRRKLTRDDISLGSSLWDAYRTGDHSKLRGLAAASSPGFPYLDEICAAAIDRDERPREILEGILSGGSVEFEDVFAEFTKRAGVYGFGDLQVERLLDQISSSSS